MFNEAQNLAIVRTELDTVFFQNFAETNQGPDYATAESGDLFKVKQITNKAWIGEINKGVGLYDEIGESDVVPADVPAVRNKYTIYVKDYAKSLPISKDLFDDNMHGVWAEDVRQMAIMARQTMNRNAFSIFRGAFTTTLTADAVALISASHTLIGGGTQSNLATGGLSATTLKNAIVKLGQMKNQAGVLMGNQPAILLVPTPLYDTAIRITNSALVAGLADNDVNYLRISYPGIKVMTSPWLDNTTAVSDGSDTAWFLLSNMHGVTRLIRQGVETALTPWQYSQNRTYLYQANFRESYFVADYWGIVGSTGL